MFSLKLPAALCALLLLAACSGKGMDHVISLKEVDKLDEIANQMSPEEGDVFRQTVVAEVGKLTLQLGLSAITEGYGDIPKDPSAVAVEPVEWSAPNEPSGGNVDVADLDNRLATLDRKIALVSKHN